MLVRNLSASSRGKRFDVLLSQMTVFLGERFDSPQSIYSCGPKALSLIIIALLEQWSLPVFKFTFRKSIAVESAGKQTFRMGISETN